MFVAFRPMAAITELTADVWPGIPKIHDIVMLRRKLVGAVGLLFASEVAWLVSVSLVWLLR